ncbi:MAG: iron ABC transporter permease [Eubacteriales bacterium]|nr:iron ABC transporter permease [Eubacteriales bacterium]
MTHKTTLRYSLLFTIGLLALLAIFLLNISLGSVQITLPEILQCFTEPELVNRSHYSIILNIRLPRTLAALAGGAALATSGILLQVFFGNPIVEPYILGISSGSTLVLALIILGGYTFGMKTMTSMGLFVGAFLGAMLVMVIVIFASQKVKSITTLLIIGMMVGYVCSAGTSVLTVIADREKIAAFSIWTMGSFAGFTWSHVKILYLVTIPFLFLAFLMSKPLNAMLLGEKYAQSMGISIRPFRFLMVLVSSVLTAVVTAFAGSISFVGLAVPHIVRCLFKTSDNRIVIPASCIYGAVMAGLCDMGARLLMSPTELPLGAMTSLIGAPIVVYLLVKQKRGEM